MMELAGLGEIKIIPPNPKFQSNEQLAEYLNSYPTYKEKLIDIIFSTKWHPEYDRSNDSSWDDTRQGWLNNPVGFENDELVMDDGNDNKMYISINPIDGDPTAFASFEISLPPNKFYCEYY